MKVGVPLLQETGMKLSRWPRPPGLVTSALVIAAAVLMARGLETVLPPATRAPLFLVAVLVVSVRYGVWMGIGAASAAFLAYNFFLIEPRYTFRVARFDDIATLTVLLIAASTTGLLAGRLKDVADVARSRAWMLEQLAEVSRRLGLAADRDSVEAVMVDHLAAIDGGDAVLLVQEGGRLVVKRAHPPKLELGPQDLQAAEQAVRRRIVVIGAAPGEEGSGFTFHPLTEGGAVVGRRRGAMPPRVRAHGDALAETILRQGQAALERLRLARNAEEAGIKAEREALRAALLSSLSHDLRTPLAAILGGVSSLREFGAELGAEARADLLLGVEEETLRLSRYVDNLLHLTRLKAGVELRLDWVDPNDPVHGAVERARRAYPGRPIGVELSDSRALIRADAVLLEQAVFNLVDNAVKFSGSESRVCVSVVSGPDAIVVDVSNEGPGIPADKLARLFEPFERKRDERADGAGLGLAITAGIVQALGGTISAESPIADGGGTRMTVVLPIAKRTPA
ncbi:ATP-binding protein [Prosthecomicrobium sp. N25]|uniref:ATP-binding protein n=1 Tax=Prosthecomicrobium sp. N25 TaxID=3129254 RepID=UPI003077F6FA